MRYKLYNLGQLTNFVVIISIKFWMVKYVNELLFQLINVWAKYVVISTVN